MKIKTDKLNRFGNKEHFWWYLKRILFFWRKYGTIQLEFKNTKALLDTCIQLNMTVEQFVTRALEEGIKRK